MELAQFSQKFFGNEKVIKLKTLPSLGLFYQDDFSMKIRKASIQDIEMYESNFIKDDISMVIAKIKTVVINNITFQKGYNFGDIRSIDIVFIFIEIVRLTIGKKIGFDYIDEDTIESKYIEFSHKNFNYINLSNDTMSMYNNKDKCFEINDYIYSLPTIGVETSLSKFLLKKEINGESHKYSDLFYDFTHFLKDKRNLSYDEVDNLVKIFNEDIEHKEIIKMMEILNVFKDFNKYSLIKDGKEVGVNARIDLENIWK
jgi:hypothetical protein